MTKATQANRLADETSPYLLQHAHNPVQWYPWGEEALAIARETDRPILLSIGYSACHWCHVMAHESFEDEATAALMNEHFVNVKVDREERPDLDKVYQLAHQLLTQRPGGWPLTVFLAPDDHTPFFAGTYFPREPRYGMSSFTEVLSAVAGFYAREREELARQSDSVRKVLAGIHRAAPEGGSPQASHLAAARRELIAGFDSVNGGFGDAPKFPQPAALERLLEHAGEGDDQALAIVTITLRRMALGGLQDQLGGGFYRYAVDARWEIPHFEKMLYDNGPLLHLYACAWQITGEPLYRDTALAIADWALREMRAPGGAFFATLDADTDGHEGGSYVWSRDEVRAALDAPEWELAAPHFGLDLRANFEGRWHLKVAVEISALAERLGLSEQELAARLASARAKLLALRAQRTQPGRDEKILTAWNGLMIRGLASAGRRLGRPDLVAAAGQALEFLRAEAWSGERLTAVHKDGRARFPAYLDDYAFLLDGVLELLQARWRGADLAFAQALADTLLAHFADPEQGGFFFTADDHEALIHRPKPYGDDSVPAGNGIAAHALQRLGHLLGEARYLDAAAGTLRAAAGAIERAPSWHNSLLRALAESLEPPELVMLRGSGEALEAAAALLEGYHPHRLVLAIPDDAPDLPEALAAYRPAPEGFSAYVCRGTQCSAPITEPAALREALA